MERELKRHGRNMAAGRKHVAPRINRFNQLMRRALRTPGLAVGNQREMLLGSSARSHAAIKKAGKVARSGR
jgi:hypothetical protein